jgi:hypothetical protein
VHGYGHNPLILPYIFQANTSTDNAQDQQCLSHPQGELINALDNKKNDGGKVFSNLHTTSTAITLILGISSTNNSFEHTHLNRFPNDQRASCTYALAKLIIATSNMCCSKR